MSAAGSSVMSGASRWLAARAVGIVPSVSASAAVAARSIVGMRIVVLPFGGAAWDTCGSYAAGRRSDGSTGANDEARPKRDGRAIRSDVAAVRGERRPLPARDAGSDQNEQLPPVQRE